MSREGSAGGASGEPRLLLATALEMARRVNAALARAGLPEAAVVGDARRGLELVTELEMLLPGPCPAATLRRTLAAAPGCTRVSVVRGGDLRLSFDGGGPAVLRVVSADHFVASVLRATGTARHVRWLESRARARGGLEAAAAGLRSERAFYASLGLPFPPPELREGPTPRVPDLVREVRGIFHVHTDWSDGSASIEEMARASAAAGFAYMGITDHSKAAVYARGLDGARLRAQARAVEDARRRVPEVVVFHGVEVDVLADGSLDLDDATLADLDFVVASVHDALDMTRREMTARLVRALRHPLVTILGHPRGRLLLGRRGAIFDVDAVAAAAAANDTCLEINANPQRLDLDPATARRAAGRGARFAVDPDAHGPGAVRDTELGLTVARRAGLGATQVLNAGPARDVSAHLSARRARARRSLGLGRP